MFWRWLYSLNLMTQPLLISSFSSAASPPLSAFRELKWVRAVLWIRLWLNGMSCLVWPILLELSPYQLSYHLCVPWNSTFNFFQDLCTHNLDSYLGQEAQLLAYISFWLAFWFASSLILIISSFWFRMRDMWLFLSLEHVQVFVGLLVGLISTLLCLKE